GTAAPVTLNIGTTAGGSQVDTVALTGDGTTGPNTVDTGTYFVAESLTTAANYTTGLACVDTSTEPATPVTVGANNAVSVGENQVVVCTFTNTRKTGSIELVKDFQGTAAPVTLNIGTTAGGSQVDTVALTGDGTTGPNSVDTGTYFVAESLTTAA